MILLFGPPGSGKSAQAQLLVDAGGWHWLSTGQLFRDSSDPKIHQLQAAGKLISDELTASVLSSAIDALDGTRNLILDGYPRNLKQAEWLLNEIARRGDKLNGVIEIDVSREELLKRMSLRARPEDTRAVIARRLDIYNDQTRPILAFYKKERILICEVDGSGTIEQVHRRVQAAIDLCLRR